MFTRTGPGVWNESAKPTPSGYAIGFGQALSVDGGTAIIAATYGALQGRYTLLSATPLIHLRGIRPLFSAAATTANSGIPLASPSLTCRSREMWPSPGLCVCHRLRQSVSSESRRGRCLGELFRLEGSIPTYVARSVAISGTVAIVGDVGALGPGIGGAYACPLETVNYTSGACRVESHVLNDSFTMSDLTTACCDGNRFTITATFTNIGVFPVRRPYFEAHKPADRPSLDIYLCDRRRGDCPW